MKDLSAPAFGYLIAFVLPGLIALAAIAGASAPTAEWLLSPATHDQDMLSLGCFLFTSITALGSGMVVSAARWALVDPLLQRCGVRPPEWDDARLFDRVEAFEALVHAHYRFYQHYSNSLVGICLLLLLRLHEAWIVSRFPSRWDAMLVLLCVLYWRASKDTLRRYYRRTERLLQRPPQEDFDDQRPQEPLRSTHHRRMPRARPAPSLAEPSHQNRTRRSKRRRRGKHRQ